MYKLYAGFVLTYHCDIYLADITTAADLTKEL